jgi:phosphatidylcholine synthase
MSLRSRYSFQIVAAAGVHIFTATGAVLGLLALLRASEGDWRGAFAWLGAALVVDGADGPLARRLQVERVLPRFSGKDLDQVVDYLNYVAVPAFILARSSIVPEGLRFPFAAGMMIVSLYHFADTRSKTTDGYFVGFPAIWNVVILYCFVLDLQGSLAAFLIAGCGALTFVPLYWVHPLRVKRLRPLTFGVVLAWGAASMACLIQGFPGSPIERFIFIFTAVYAISVGLTAGARRSRLHPAE